MKPLLRLAVFVAAITLVGCASRTELYSWGPYEDQVYAHFKNESPDQQIQILENHAQEAQSNGRKLPPGYRAHLGLLYSKVGREADFIRALQQERAEFPESAPYIDSLLARAGNKRENRNDQK